MRGAACGMRASSARSRAGACAAARRRAPRRRCSCAGPGGARRRRRRPRSASRRRGRPRRRGSTRSSAASAAPGTPRRRGGVRRMGERPARAAQHGHAFAVAPTPPAGTPGAWPGPGTVTKVSRDWAGPAGTRRARALLRSLRSTPRGEVRCRRRHRTSTHGSAHAPGRLVRRVHPSQAAPGDRTKADRRPSAARKGSSPLTRVRFRPGAAGAGGGEDAALPLSMQSFSGAVLLIVSAHGVRRHRGGRHEMGLRVGAGPDELEAIETFPTTAPEETIGRAAGSSARTPRRRTRHRLVRPDRPAAGSPTWGRITTTPKPGWADTDVGAALGAALDVPVAFDTDVNAAALGEQRWGAAVGLTPSATSPSARGSAAAVVGRAAVHGLLHPELGHMRVPHDRGATRSRAAARSTATASKGSPPAGRSARAGAGPREELADDATRGGSRRSTSRSALVNVDLHRSRRSGSCSAAACMQAAGAARARPGAVRELVAGYVAAPELGGRARRVHRPARRSATVPACSGRSSSPAGRLRNGDSPR